jgi:hypothetical protein
VSHWLRRSGLRTLAVGAALLLDLLVLRAQIDAVIGSAVCLERAKFELILCAAPPDEWQIALTSALALALSITLGALLAPGRRLTT